MPLSLLQWHQRYQQQARWTHNLREYLFSKARILPTARILDVGCGTGVLESELLHNYSSRAFGLDVDTETLKFAKGYAQDSIYITGDGRALPFPSRAFDVTFCHFVLLWVKDVQKVISEMVRVTHKNGYVIALAEPDYGGRIDFPNELSQIGEWQIEALQQQGANPFIGRELRAIFHQAGLVDIEVGVMGGQWEDTNTSQDNELEWEVIQSDLFEMQEFTSQLDQLKSLELLSRTTHQRVLFVPTFYAIGMIGG